MRSRLEAGFAAWLDRCGFAWEYEPQCFASKDGQYLPDFMIEHLRVMDKVVDRSYIEVKPTTPIGPDKPSHVLDRMAMIWDSDPDAELFLVWPNKLVKMALWNEESAVIKTAPMILRLRRLERDGSREVGLNVCTWGVSCDARSVMVIQPIGQPTAPWPPGYWDGPQ